MINLKIKKYTLISMTILLSYLTLYIIHAKYIFLILPFGVFIYILKRLKLPNVRYFLFFYIYVLFELLYSLYFNELKIVLMDSKFVVMMLLFYVFYILSYKQILKLNNFSHATIVLIVSIGIFAILSIYGSYRFGNRDDFGNALVILLPLLFYYYKIHKISLNKFIILIIFCLISLAIMQGRTALITFVFGLFLIYLYRSKLKIVINKNIIFIFLLISFIVAFKVFMFRAGVDNENLKHEARYLAFFIFLDILQHLNLQHFLFGYGLGAYFDKFANNVAIAAAHVSQIKNSSGVGHYISWGFHNNIIRMFLLLGFTGSILLYLWQISLFYLKKKDFKNQKIVILKTILKIIFLSSLLLSFSNGIYGTTLVASLLFTFQGVIYGEIKYLERNIS